MRDCSEAPAQLPVQPDLRNNLFLGTRQFRLRKAMKRDTPQHTLYLDMPARDVLDFMIKTEDPFQCRLAFTDAL